MKRLARFRAGRGWRGSSLIEVLVAMAILAVLMVGVLQLYSVALVTDSGSAARTDMTLKAQQVAENLRYLHFLRSQGTAIPAGTGLPSSPVDGATTNLPWADTDANWAYWGPNGANILEQSKPPYRLSYTYSTSTTPDYWFVTVTAVHEQASEGMQRYIGTGAKPKRVDYVFQVHQ